MDPRGLLALGRALARAGLIAKLALAVAVLTVLASVVLAFAMAGSTDRRSLEELPLAAANLQAWGAGVLLAFAASARALRRDREDGIRDLYRARGGSDTAYLWARVAGLAVELAIVVGGGAMLAGGVAALLAERGAAAIHTLEASAAAVVYSLVFAAVLAPLAMATLGARSRMGGYLVLLTVLVVPELLSGWTSQILPAGWGRLASIPGAMTALRVAISPAHLDVALLARSLAILALVSATALLAVRAELAGLEAEAPPYARGTRT